MTALKSTDNVKHSFAHLSTAHSEWEEIAESHRAIEERLDKLYSLPIEEFRKVPYRPPPLPRNAPVPGQDLVISQSQVAVRDGTLLDVRIYQPLNVSDGHLLFFNVHGGGTDTKRFLTVDLVLLRYHLGWTVGTPETEEIQNRLIAVRNNAVVISVDYRL